MSEERVISLLGFAESVYGRANEAHGSKQPSWETLSERQRNEMKQHVKDGLRMLASEADTDDPDERVMLDAITDELKVRGYVEPINYQYVLYGLGKPEVETDMERYIGVKVVDARPMTSEAFNERIGRNPRPEDKTGDGYLVVYPDGYEAWCPKDVFEESNRPGQEMPFGHAFEAARQGCKVARKGWDGLGQFVFVSCPEGRAVAERFIWSEAGREVARKHDGVVAVLPYLMLKDVDDSIVPWAPSQGDLFGDDWMLVD